MKVASLEAFSAQEEGYTKTKGLGVAKATAPIANFAGKKVQFSGYIKTENITDGYAGLWWRVDGKSGTLALDNMQNRGAKGTTNWQRYQIDSPVSADAKDVVFGVLHPGNGTAWFDGLTITVDGKPYHPDDVGLDFEYKSPFGFDIAGKGYEIMPDTEVFRSGKQSLRISYENLTSDEAEFADPKIAVATWDKVVKHLEASADRYGQEGVSQTDTAWGIQNARIVLQCMKMKANQTGRDTSMAQNVKWIFDNSPGAKIVVWAHNAHVSRSGYSEPDPMGASLHEMFGKQMVGFGFVFDQGSFQARNASEGLRTFTVSPAEPGSLADTLAATRIPLFAVDLRSAPLAGPVETWLGLPHPVRDIGAIFSTSTESKYIVDMVPAKSFDALVFFDKTTAAHEIVETP